MRTLYEVPVLSGGDWNGHIGKYSEEPHIVGTTLLKYRTANGGKLTTAWVRGDGRFFADSFLGGVRERGTWQSQTGNWLEIDYFIADRDLKGHLFHLQVLDSGISDHRLKTMRFALPMPGAKNKKEKSKAKLAHIEARRLVQEQTNAKRKLRTDLLRGPTPEAKE